MVFLRGNPEPALRQLTPRCGSSRSTAHTSASRSRTWWPCSGDGPVSAADRGQSRTAGVDPPADVNPSQPRNESASRGRRGSEPPRPRRPQHRPRSAIRTARPPRPRPCVVAADQLMVTAGCLLCGCGFAANARSCGRTLGFASPRPAHVRLSTAAQGRSRPSGRPRERAAVARPRMPSGRGRAALRPRPRRGRRPDPFAYAAVAGVHASHPLGKAQPRWQRVRPVSATSCTT